MKQLFERRLKINHKSHGVGYRGGQGRDNSEQSHSSTNEGWEIEAYQRYDDVLIENMNLKEANRVTLPCEADRRGIDDVNRIGLEEEEESWQQEPIPWPRTAATVSSQ